MSKMNLENSTPNIPSRSYKSVVAMSFAFAAVTALTASAIVLSKRAPADCPEYEALGIGGPG